MFEAALTAARLRELVSYDPETGVFTRRVRTAQRHQVGDRADFPITTGRRAGCRRISVDSMRFLAHRAAWLYMTGAWPENEVDHRDTDPSNNCWLNLRDISGAVNAQNVRRPRAGSKSGVLGVVPYGDGRWRARVNLAGKQHHVGLYSSAEEAHAAYVLAKRQIHPGCTL